MPSHAKGLFPRPESLRSTEVLHIFSTSFLESPGTWSPKTVWGFPSFSGGHQAPVFHPKGPPSEAVLTGDGGHSLFLTRRRERSEFCPRSTPVISCLHAMKPLLKPSTHPAGSSLLLLPKLSSLFQSLSVASPRRILFMIALTLSVLPPPKIGAYVFYLLDCTSLHQEIAADWLEKSGQSHNNL